MVFLVVDVWNWDINGFDDARSSSLHDSKCTREYKTGGGREPYVRVSKKADKDSNTTLSVYRKGENRSFMSIHQPRRNVRGMLAVLKQSSHNEIPTISSL